jgi:cytochrome c oxidase subunit 2
MATPRQVIIYPPPVLFHPLHKISLDAPEPWGIGFQDAASPVFEGITELHDTIFFYLLVIGFGVTWVLASVVVGFNASASPLSHKYYNHGTLVELIWTITPAMVLIALALPSFKLLYLSDEVITPSMTIKAVGHQWYWSYEYSDYIDEAGDPVEYDAYMVPESDLEEGQLRLLEVDNRVVLPVDTHVRFVVTGADVIHDFAVPALGLKIDAFSRHPTDQPAETDLPIDQQRQLSLPLNDYTLRPRTMG